MRPLGNWETLHALIHDMAGGHGVVSAALGLSENLLPEIFNTAVKKLYQRHPFLRATIKTSDTA